MFFFNFGNFATIIHKRTTDFEILATNFDSMKNDNFLIFDILLFLIFRCSIVHLSLYMLLIYNTMLSYSSVKSIDNFFDYRPILWILNGNNYNREVVWPVAKFSSRIIQRKLSNALMVYRVLVTTILLTYLHGILFAHSLQRLKIWRF